MLNRFINLSQKLPIVYEFPPVFQCFRLFFIKFCTILERNEIKGNMGTNCVNKDSYDQAALNQINLSFYRTSSYNRNFFIIYAYYYYYYYHYFQYYHYYNCFYLYNYIIKIFLLLFTHWLPVHPYFTPWKHQRKGGWGTNRLRNVLSYVDVWKIFSRQPGLRRHFLMYGNLGSQY